MPREAGLWRAVARHLLGDDGGFAAVVEDPPTRLLPDPMGFRDDADGPVPLAIAASVAYALLPGRLLHPHVLSTEAFFTPLLVGHVALLTRALATPRGRPAALLGAGVAAGLAAFLRPSFAVFPLVEAALLLVWSGLDRRWIAGMTVAAMLGGFAVPLTSVARGGVFGWGISAQSLESNLHGRAERIARFAGTRLDTSGRAGVLPP